MDHKLSNPGLAMLHPLHVVIKSLLAKESEDDPDSAAYSPCHLRQLLKPQKLQVLHPQNRHQNITSPGQECVRVCHVPVLGKTVVIKPVTVLAHIK